MKMFVKSMLIILMIGSLALMQVGYADPPLPTPIGRVVWVKGTLKALMQNKEERSLQKTSVIYLNDLLTTDSTSQAQVVFTDNTLMTFKENTKFSLDKYQFTPKAKGSSGKYVMGLIEGGFRTITGLIAKKNPNNYQINTPVATIGVRGTDYAVQLKDGDAIPAKARSQKLYIAQYDGSPCVITDKKKVCLTDENRFAHVPEKGADPTLLSEQPEVFREKLDIVAATIELFDSGGSVTKATRSNYTPRGAPSGTITSFCIQ